MTTQNADREQLDRIEAAINELLATLETQAEELWNGLARVERLVNGPPPQERKGGVGWLCVTPQVYAKLVNADVLTIADVRRRLDAGTLGDVRGIGPAKINEIRAALVMYDEREGS